MSDLVNELFNCKNITDNSRKLYIRNLLKLNENKPIKNLTFLKSKTKVLDKIKDYKPNTQRAFIISVVSLLNCAKTKDNKFNDLYITYFEILEEMNKNLRDATKKTDNEIKNMISQDEVKKIYDEYEYIYNEIKNNKKLSNSDYINLLKYLVLSLYILNKPRRNTDYQNMLIVKEYNDDMDKKYNYLDMKNNEFIFNNYKTAKTYKSLTVKLDDDLIDIIKTFLKYHPNRKNIGKDKVYLLVDENGEYFKNINSMTRFLYKIFGRKIGVSMLRKIYLTDKYKETVDNLKKDAVLMGNSIDTILNNYIKQ
jgi:hypothetical protein